MSHYLYLNYNQITSLQGLGNLEQLRSLYLRDNQITSLQDLGNLEQLRSLYLNYNQITSLQGLDGLVQLQLLYLRANQITEIQGLNGLVQLQSLSLSYNQITFLQDLDNLEQLQSLNLYNNPIQNIPQELLGTSDGDNCLVDIQNYKAALQKGSSPDTTIKLIFVGNGRVGKTCVAEVLQGHGFPENSESTHGITIAQWQPQGSTAQFSLWDFGGQEIYHATHRLFLSQNGLYVLVWAKTTEEDEKEVRHPLPYWLDYIQDLSQGSPIILVENQIDKNKHQPSPIPNHAALMEQYPNIQTTVAMSAYTGRNLRMFQVGLLDLAEAMLDKRQYEIPTTWQKLQYRLLQARDSGKKRLNQAQFIAIAQKETIAPSEAKTILMYLHKDGFLYHQENAFNNTIILDQNWAIEAIYKIFDRRLPHRSHIEKAGGYFSKSYAYNIIWKDQAKEEVDIYLNFIKSCEIAYADKKRGESEDKNTPYFIPQFLPTQPSRLLQKNWKKNKSSLYMRLAHDFFHLAVLQRFIIRAAHLAPKDEIWRKGISIDNEKQGVEALIEVVELDEIEAGYPRQQIQIRTGGQSPQDHEFLQQIRNEFHKIRSHNLVEWVSTDGEYFASKNNLKEAEQAGLSKVKCQCGRYQTIANFSLFLHKNMTDKGLPEKTKQQKRPKKVVALYYKQDKKYFKRLKNHLKPFTRKSNKRIQLWDISLVKIGQVIEETIQEELDAADSIIALISSDFLADKDCYELLNKAEGTAEQNQFIPILIRPSMYKFEDFANLQILPRNKIPISKWKDQDEAWVKVVQELEKLW